MNKNSIIIAVSILLSVLVLGGVLIYVHQSDMNFKAQQLELEKQKEQTKIDTANKENADKAAEEFANQASYNACIAAAETKRDQDLQINSNYETKDTQGGVVYHGNATVFDNIEAAAIQEKSRCSLMYQ